MYKRSKEEYYVQLGSHVTLTCADYVTCVYLRELLPVFSTEDGVWINTKTCLFLCRSVIF